jgi:hypothetical protein
MSSYNGINDLPETSVTTLRTRYERYARTQRAPLIFRAIRERKVGQQALEIEFFAAMRATDRERNEAGAPLSLTRLCELNSVSRAGFYRWSHAPEAVDRDLREIIDKKVEPG